MICRISFVVILLVGGASAFSPSAIAPLPNLQARASASPQLRSAGVMMAQLQDEAKKAVTNAALTALVAGSMFAGPMLPVEASLNSQMSMNTESFSVLTDNQKVYTQKARAVNPYASEEEQMRQLERIARLEECTARGNTMVTCEQTETTRMLQEQQVAAQKRRNPLTFAVPIVITTALSGVLIKVLNR